MTGLVVGAVAATVGLWADWYAVKQPYTRASWDPRAPLEVTVFSVVALAVLAPGIVFAMIVGARRNVVPRIASLGLAIFTAIGLACLGWALTGTQNPVELYNENADPGSYGNFFHKVPMHFNAWPYVAAAGMLLVLIAATWLWWVGRATARESAEALARAEREAAVRAGDLRPEA